MGPPAAQAGAPPVSLPPSVAFTAAAAKRPDSASVDSLQPLLLLQAFDGAWTHGEELAGVLGTVLSDLAPPESDLPDTLWGTALGLAFLQLRFPARWEEWALVAQKARSWLQAAGCDPEALVVHARELLERRGAN